jgi:predicted nucleic acid-binding protein
MRRAVLADTGPTYAAVDPSDDSHERARKDIERLNREGFGVALTYSTLCEGYSLVLYKLGLEVAHRWLEETRENASQLNPTPEDYRAAEQVVLRYRDQGLSLFDAIAAVVGERLSWRCGPTITTST